MRELIIALIRRFRMQSNVAELEEPTKNTLEQLVILPPPAETLFELTKEDLKKLGIAITKLFAHKGTYIDKYIKYNNQWNPHQINPLTFQRFELINEGNHPYARDAKILFDNYVYSIRLNWKPKIAFLPNREKPEYTRALYISEGKSELNPWAPRTETIFVIR